MLDFPDYHYIINHPLLSQESKSDWLQTLLDMFQFQTVREILDSCWFPFEQKECVINVLKMAKVKSAQGCAVTLKFNGFFLIYRIRPDKTCLLEKVLDEEEFIKFGKNDRIEIVQFYK